MAERKLIQEISKLDEFHSVVMTTFSFDFHHFESQVLRPLKQRGMTSYNVLVDTAMLDKSIGFSTGHLKSLCNNYSVHTIPCRGAFHPKIIFLAGDNEVMFIQGSGNITTGGHGKNHELFSVYYANNEDQIQLPLIQETWNYLRQLMVSVKGIGETKLERIESNCNLLNKVDVSANQWLNISENYRVAALYNGSSGIWQQLTNLIPTEIVEEILVFSPFYDENGDLLKKLVSHFKCEIKAFLQDGKGIHPFNMVPDEKIKFFSWDSTERSTETTNKYKRKLHSKIFWFYGKEANYCLFGSPNCTLRAFGTEKTRGNNDEFALLVQMPSDDWLKELGLIGDYKSFTPQSNELIFQIEKDLEAEQIKNLGKVRILGVDQNEEVLTIYLLNKVGISDGYIIIYNQWGQEIEKHFDPLNKDKIELRLKKDNYKAAAYVCIVNELGEAISNKQIANNIFDLWNSDPSAENRNLIKLAARIEMGKERLFDIVDFFNAINNKTKAEKGLLHKLKANNYKEKKKTDSIANISYEDSLELECENSEFNKILKHHHSVQLFDAIEKYFRDLASEEQDEDMSDEEDLNSATKGRTRTERKERNGPVQLNSITVIKSRQEQFIKFLNNYCKALDKALSSTQHKIGLVDLAMYLIVINLLVDFAERKVILKIKEDGMQDKKHILFPVEGNIMELTSLNGAIFNIVGKFISLLYQYPLEETLDSFSQQKLDRYLVLCKRTTLFTLATMRSLYEDGNKYARNFNLLAYNILKRLGKPESEFNKDLNNYAKQISLSHFSIEKTEEILTLWATDYDNLEYNLDLHIDNKYGICHILKQIPPKGKAKYYRLARPGFLYDEEHKDFVLPLLYSIETGNLIESMQKYNAQKRLKNTL